VGRPKVTTSGTTTTISFGWLSRTFTLRSGVLSATGCSFALAEYRYAGLAQVPVPIRSRLGAEMGERQQWELLLWKDSKTWDSLWAPTGLRLAQLRDDPAAFAATPWGLLAARLDAAVAACALSAPPNLEVGSYLPNGGGAVWIPRLGSVIPI